MACITSYEIAGKKILDRLLEEGTKEDFEYIKERARANDMSVVGYCGKYKQVVLNLLKDYENEQSK